MKCLTLTGLFFLCFSSLLGHDNIIWFLTSLPTEESCKKYYCRITYYHPYQDRWGSRVACPKTRRAKQGITVAAHPNFEFGTQVFIPDLAGKVGDGHFVVQDRGAWVTKKKASRGKNYVFDVYISTKSSYYRMVKNRPYMWVYAPK